jgi:hypothetical protein
MNSCLHHLFDPNLIVSIKSIGKVAKGIGKLWAGKRKETECFAVIRDLLLRDPLSCPTTDTLIASNNSRRKVDELAKGISEIIYVTKRTGCVLYDG